MMQIDLKLQLRVPSDWVTVAHTQGTTGHMDHSRLIWAWIRFKQVGLTQRIEITGGGNRVVNVIKGNNASGKDNR